jgi:hypothetical protein
MSKREQPEHILTILKVRMGHDQAAPAATTGNTQSTKTKSKRKMGKAEKKRLMAAQLAEADTIFDNPEEQLLFMVYSFIKLFVLGWAKIKMNL